MSRCTRLTSSCSSLASPIVDWSAIWKICLVALAAGAGTVVIFGFLLLGLKFADTAGTDGTQGSGSRVGGLTLAVLCGADLHRDHRDRHLRDDAEVMKPTQVLASSP